jgi:hypothetical protein
MKKVGRESFSILNVIGERDLHAIRARLEWGVFLLKEI